LLIRWAIPEESTASGRRGNMFQGSGEKGGRPVPSTGAGLLPFLFFVLFPAVSFCLSGCVGSETDATGGDAELLEAMGLSPRARLHRITLGGRGAQEHAVPTLIQASPGDGVEFLTVDHRVHTVSFPADSLSPEVRLFLSESGQRSSPPLVSRGSRFILNLQNAPPGRYPFVSEGHGGRAGGVVQVGDPTPADSVRG
jgi:plastocyanin